jgi:hypothetical protein
LFSYLIAVNEKLTWNGSFLRGFPTRSVKTEAKVTLMPCEEVKTKRPPFLYEQESAETFARCRRLLKGSADAKYTYFMRDRQGGGLIKIGMSQDPDARRAALSASGYHDMEILLTLRDGCLEGLYHQHFADLCVGGEWFEPHPDIFAEIERLTPKTHVPPQRGRGTLANLA